MLNEWPEGHVAHRGLHNTANGVLENSPAAFQAAMTKGFAIECDVQALGDGTPLVFHDYSWERLTERQGCLLQSRKADLKQIRLINTEQNILTLVELLELVAGQVPVLVEIKSDWRRPHQSAFRRMLKNIVKALEGYKGQYGLMSFDPNPLRILQNIKPRLPIGLTSCDYSPEDWPKLDRARRARLRNLQGLSTHNIDFFAHDIETLEDYAPVFRQRFPTAKLFSWTIRTRAQFNLAKQFADHMIFEGQDILNLLDTDQ